MFRLRALALLTALVATLALTGSLYAEQKRLATIDPQDAKWLYDYVWQEGTLPDSHDIQSPVLSLRTPRPGPCVNEIRISLPPENPEEKDKRLRGFMFRAECVVPFTYGGRGGRKFEAHGDVAGGVMIEDGTIFFVKGPYIKAEGQLIPLDEEVFQKSISKMFADIVQREKLKVSWPRQ